MSNKENPQPDILNMSLYESFDLNHYTYDQLSQVLLFHEDEMDAHSISSIDSFCIECKKPTTFKSANSSQKDLEDVYLGIKAGLEGKANTVDWEFDVVSFYKKLNEIEFFTRSFYCPRASKDKSHNITIVLRVNENKAIKIGQYPPLALIESSHTKKYKALDKDIYTELNRAIGLNTHGIGVGSFVYLRRIIEKYIVYPELIKLTELGELKKKQINATDFKGKITLAREHLPTVLVDTPKIYSILSKGIHNLSEEECLEVFQPLLTAIELILDEKLEKIEREQKLQKMKSDIDRIK